MSDLSELDDLLAELDTIDTGSSKPPARASNTFNSKPVATPVAPKPTPIAVKTTPAAAPKPATAVRNSYAPNNGGTDWDELDALVAKFDSTEQSSNNRSSVAPSNNRSSVAPANNSRASVAPTNRSTRAPTDLNALQDLDSTFSPPPANRQSYVPSSFPDYTPPKQDTYTPPTNTYTPPSNNDNYNSRPVSTRRMTQTIKTAPSIPGACPQCSQPVTGEHLLAMGQKWHSNHFVCSDCGVFINGEFYEHNNKPKCRNCFESKYNCSKCGGNITGEYFMGSGGLFHTHCVDRHSCARCAQMIGPTERELRALDKFWHAHCFSCSSCRNDLRGSFFSVEGQPYCENCANNRAAQTTGNCFTCNRSISSGSYVSYEGRGYHNECFTCSRCRTVLNLSGFYTLNNQPVCGNCAR